MQVKDVNVIRVESRLSQGDSSHFEVIVDCDIAQEPLQELTQQLRKRVHDVKIGRCNSSSLQDDGRRVKRLCMSHSHVNIAKGENVTTCKIYFSVKRLKICLHFRGGWCTVVS